TVTDRQHPARRSDDTRATRPDRLRARRFCGNLRAGVGESARMDRREALQLAAMLLGGALSASCTRALQGGVTSSGGPSVRVLDAAELATVAQAAERIMPRTDTPGAIDAGVPDFIHR